MVRDFIDAYTVQLLQDIGDELSCVHHHLQLSCPTGVNFIPPKPLSLRLRDCPDVIDKLSVRSCLLTNRTFDNMPLPCDQVLDGDGQPHYVPHFASLHTDLAVDGLAISFLDLREDIPYGLLLAYYIGQQMDPQLPMPKTRKLLEWAQAQLNKAYLVHGQPVGRCMVETRCPGAGADLESMIDSASRGGSIRMTSVHVQKEVSGLASGGKASGLWATMGEMCAFSSQLTALLLGQQQQQHAGSKELMDSSMYSTLLMLTISVTWTIMAACAVVASNHNVPALEVILLNSLVAWSLNSGYGKAALDSSTRTRTIEPVLHLKRVCRRLPVHSLVLVMCHLSVESNVSRFGHAFSTLHARPHISPPPSCHGLLPDEPLGVPSRCRKHLLHLVLDVGSAVRVARQRRHPPDRVAGGGLRPQHGQERSHGRSPGRGFGHDAVQQAESADAALRLHVQLGGYVPVDRGSQ